MADGEKPIMPSVSDPIAIIGAGPAGLMAATRLAQAGYAVTLYERMPTPARKLLMAGRGGLNLTHSEPLERFESRYHPSAAPLLAAIRAFPPEALRAFAADLGQPTFIGTSGRVFPESFKASSLLRAWLARLAAMGVRLSSRHHWQGWTPDGALSFTTPEGVREVFAPATILALGGASWPRLGGDGGWMDLLRERGIDVAPFVPANMGLCIGWSQAVGDLAGTPLKRIAVSCDGVTVRGEAMLTPQGLEGGAIYAVSARVREHLVAGARAQIHLDLRPDLSLEALRLKLAAVPERQSLSSRLRKGAGLSPAAARVLREAGPAPGDAAGLAARIKAVPLEVTGTFGLERAISSAGGVRWASLDAQFALRGLPGVFACGEMVDWEAPTGGYLLQACFSTGRAAAEGVMAWLG